MLGFNFSAGCGAFLYVFFCGISHHPMQGPVQGKIAVTVVFVYIIAMKTTFYFNFDFLHQYFKQQRHKHVNKDKSSINIWKRLLLIIIRLYCIGIIVDHCIKICELRNLVLKCTKPNFLKIFFNENIFVLSDNGE